MHHNFLMFLLLLCSALPVQAADKGMALIQDQELTSELLMRTTSPKLGSSIALIYDAQVQRPLYTKNANSVAPIASISKLMTAMVVLDAQLPMDEDIRISKKDMDTLKGTRSRIRPGMILTRGELFKLSLMASENTAAAALARTYPGGLSAAITQMNIKAYELGMRDTNFVDPTGLNRGNVSTAQDLVKMVLAAQGYPAIQAASTLPSHNVMPVGRGSMHFNNTNPLVRSASWDIGISKTGYISEAGRCLVMQATIKQRQVVIVLLDSWGKSTRLGDANRIRKWMESTYERDLRRG